MVCVEGEASSETLISREAPRKERALEQQGSRWEQHAEGTSKDKSTVDFAFPSSAGPLHPVLHHQVKPPLDILKLWSRHLKATKEPSRAPLASCT